MLVIMRTSSVVVLLERVREYALGMANRHATDVL